MKAFVISLSIVFAIFILTIANSIYINNLTNTLICHAKELNISDNSVDEFSSLWQENQFAIRISSSHEETHKIDEVLEVLKTKARENNISGFYEDRALLIEYLIQIQEDETVSFDSII